MVVCDVNLWIEVNTLNASLILMMLEPRRLSPELLVCTDDISCNIQEIFTSKYYNNDWYIKIYSTDATSIRRSSLTKVHILSPHILVLTVLLRTVKILDLLMHLWKGWRRSVRERRRMIRRRTLPVVKRLAVTSQSQWLHLVLIVSCSSFRRASECPYWIAQPLDALQP